MRTRDALHTSVGGRRRIERDTRWSRAAPDQVARHRRHPGARAGGVPWPAGLFMIIARKIESGNVGTVQACPDLEEPRVPDQLDEGVVETRAPGFARFAVPDGALVELLNGLGGSRRTHHPSRLASGSPRCAPGPSRGRLRVRVRRAIAPRRGRARAGGSRRGRTRPIVPLRASARPRVSRPTRGRRQRALRSGSVAIGGAVVGSGRGAR